MPVIGLGCRRRLACGRSLSEPWSDGQPSSARSLHVHRHRSTSRSSHSWRQIVRMVIKLDSCRSRSVVLRRYDPAAATLPRLHERPRVTGQSCMVRPGSPLVSLHLPRLRSARSRRPRRLPPTTRPRARRRLSRRLLRAQSRTGDLLRRPGRRHDRLPDNRSTRSQAWQAQGGRAGWPRRRRSIPRPSQPRRCARPTRSSREALEGSIGRARVPHELWNVSQMTGWQVQSAISSRFSRSAPTRRGRRRWRAGLAAEVHRHRDRQPARRAEASDTPRRRATCGSSSTR